MTLSNLPKTATEIKMIFTDYNYTMIYQYVNLHINALLSPLAQPVL